MPRLLQSLWITIDEAWSRLRVRDARRRLHLAAVNRATERLVDQTNPALRGMGSYRRRLFPVAERLLSYSQELIDQIPGPVALDRASWAAEPLVNALFGNIERMRQVLSGPQVRAWLKANPVSESDDLYGLLSVVPQQRSQLGMELQGDVVQRDVRQVSLGFAEHEIAVVADSMDALREALLVPVTDVIASVGIGRLVAQEERVADLEQSLRMLRLKLKVVNPRVSGVDLMLAGSAQHLAERDRLKALIAETEGHLADARQGLGNIEDYLARVCEVLARPEQEIRLERLTLWVDRMNIVREQDSGDARQITLVRARRAEQPGRIAVYVRFPRSLVVSPDERLRQVEHYLGGQSL